MAAMQANLATRGAAPRESALPFPANKPEPRLKSIEAYRSTPSPIRICLVRGVDPLTHPIPPSCVSSSIEPRGDGLKLFPGIADDVGLFFAVAMSEAQGIG